MLSRASLFLLVIIADSKRTQVRHNVHDSTKRNRDAVNDTSPSILKPDGMKSDHMIVNVSVSISLGGNKEDKRGKEKGRMNEEERGWKEGERLELDVDDRQDNELNIDSFCDTGCPSKTLSDDDGAHLSTSCKSYQKCVTLSNDPANAKQFPYFSRFWCDQTMESIIEQLCGGSEEGIVHHAELSMHKLQSVVKIVGDEKDAVRNGQWGVCSKIASSSVEMVKGSEMRPSKEVPPKMNCYECTRETHRGGVSQFFATSWECAWDAENGYCGNSYEMPETAIKNYVDCGQTSPDEALMQTSSVINVTHGTRGRNVALLVAFDYAGSSSHLAGTVPDIERVFAHLTQYQGFNARDITVVTDSRNIQAFRGGTVYQVTKYNGTPMQVLEIMDRVVNSLQAGDYFIFQFSGHGSTTIDHGADELDGWDEVLIMASGDKLYDDQFYDRLVRIPRGVIVFAQVDACHSEGFADLPFNYLSGQRVWCTDWAKPKKLPQAYITYISGSQNSQTSADKGYGGALSLHAIQLWVRPLQMHKALDDVCNALPTQDPSLMGYPTFRDTVNWSPYNPTLNVERDPSNSLGAQQSNSKMRVPSICRHGRDGNNGKSHRRKPHLVRLAASRFMVDDRLDSATTQLSDTVEGGIRRGDIVEGWQSYSQQTQAPVVQHVVVGSACTCAGQSPRGQTIGRSCGRLLADHKMAPAHWCYVRSDSPCRDKQPSGLSATLMWSEEACQTHSPPAQAYNQAWSNAAHGGQTHNQGGQAYNQEWLNALPGGQTHNQGGQIYNQGGQIYNQAGHAGHYGNSGHTPNHGGQTYNQHLNYAQQAHMPVATPTWHQNINSPTPTWHQNIAGQFHHGNQTLHHHGQHTVQYASQQQQQAQSPPTDHLPPCDSNSYIHAYAGKFCQALPRSNVGPMTCPSNSQTFCHHNSKTFCCCVKQGWYNYLTRKYTYPQVDACKP
eukprot:gnl/MRDRNA2_/MRDRNA2_83391_c1_seq1.p1 gnl/MRDRNA2_/MRDRNA2_83391_c1~~gnl/MRDRNA2_/MRDRNA2_83391_c1_seq1.p1  ORF type:complete len:950 (+),score=107.21 gnl/MRDRNA2_/MRDRNA2_83391_c1_seq1:198-3047(+)